MNNERIQFGHEQPANSLESIEAAGVERAEVLQERRVELEQNTVESSADTARSEALERARSLEDDEPAYEVESAPAIHHGPMSAQATAQSFKRIMGHTQAQLSAPSRAFSKIIHNSTIERTSEAAAKTVARPNAVLSGALFAFILTLAVYVVAKKLGYPLSGFESIAAFILGWVIGIIYDFLRAMITGKRA